MNQIQILTFSVLRVQEHVPSCQSSALQAEGPSPADQSKWWGWRGITLQSTLTLTELANHIALHGESLKTSTLLALQMQQLTVEVKFQRIVTMKKIPHEWHNDRYQRMDF